LSFPESDEQKKALVQWFVRVCEVPPNKMKLLGRTPHPLEIFYYEGRTCDDEIDVESILGTVQVRTRLLVHLNRPFSIKIHGSRIVSITYTYRICSEIKKCRCPAECAIEQYKYHN